MKTYCKIFILLVLAAFIAQADNTSAATLTMDINPAIVEIGTFYNGTTITVKGQLPAQAEAVIRLSGQAEELHLKRKGKIGGLLWMNVSDLTFDNAPRVYMVMTGKGLTDLDNSPARNLGLPALKNRIEISPESNDNDFLLEEFIRLKTKQGLYSKTSDGISYGPEKDGLKSYEATISIPSSMQQGDYTVDVAVVQDGTLLATTSKALPLKQTGLPEKISKMAYGHALMYGIMAVVIALMAGLFMGIVFKDQGGAH